MKRLLMIIIVICISIGLCLSIGLLFACCTNTKVEEATTEESITEEPTDTYAWITRWETNWIYTNGDKTAPKVIEGYVKEWQSTSNGGIYITFENGDTYYTGINNVLIKETKG